MIDQYTKAAVIGYWRSGATKIEIVLLTDLTYWEVEEIILSIMPCVMLAEYDAELKSVIVK